MRWSSPRRSDQGRWPGSTRLAQSTRRSRHRPCRGGGRRPACSAIFFWSSPINSSGRQMLRVQATNWLPVMPVSPPSTSLSRSLLHTVMYSCTSRNVGLVERPKLPQAVLTPALAPLSQIMCPRCSQVWPLVRNCSSIRLTSERYGLRSVLATLTHNRPPGDQHPITLPPHGVEQADVLFQAQIVVVVGVVLRYVVGRRRDDELHRRVRHGVHAPRIAADDVVEPGVLLCRSS